MSTDHTSVLTGTYIFTAMEKDIFNKRIEDHLRWILNKKDGMVADFGSLSCNRIKLNGINLRSMCCEDTQFIDGYLNNIIMTDAVLYDVHFDGTQFHNCIMMNMNCQLTSFKDTKFYSSVLTNSIFEDVDFSDSTLENIRMNGIICNGYVQFANADLNGSIITDSKLRGVDFTGANLDNVDFSNSDLSCADLTGASIKNTNFRNARLDNAILPESFSKEGV